MAPLGLPVVPPEVKWLMTASRSSGSSGASSGVSRDEVLEGRTRWHPSRSRQTRWRSFGHRARICAITGSKLEW